MNQLSDIDLIHLILLNNNSAISYLFYNKCSSMFNYIIKEVFSYQVEKDELISELYLYLCNDNWKKVREFEGRSKFTTWLSVVAVRFFLKKKISMIDSKANCTPYSESAMHIPCKISHASMIERMDLINAIQKLKNGRDKFVILSIEIEGYEAEEVAKQLGITKANLYNIKKRALNKLSDILKDYNYANE